MSRDFIDQKRKSDYSKWTEFVYKVPSFSDFLLIKEFSDGVYTIPSGNGTIDILIKGFLGRDNKNNISNSDLQPDCIVCFSGALTDQVASSPPPYFSGLGISSSSGLPLISFSDPTLTFSDNLNLAWYAGNCSERNLQVLLSLIIDHICFCYGFRPVFVGGSGGGFAALVQSLLFKRDSVTLVWNPQTSIGRYKENVVLDFLDVAFPNVDNFIEKSSGVEVPNNDNSKLLNRLWQTGVLHDLCNFDWPHKSKVIFLQNKNDWHVVTHAKPYLHKNEMSRLGNTIFMSGKNIFVHFGDWGLYHTPPSTKIIVDLLIDVSKKFSFESILYKLDVKNDYYPLFDADMKCDWIPDFVISIKNKKTFIIIKNCLKKAEYALYWFCGNEKNVFWYQTSPKFMLPVDFNEVEALQFFMKDSWEDVRCFYVNKQSILSMPYKHKNKKIFFYKKLFEKS